MTRYHGGNVDGARSDVVVVDGYGAGAGGGGVVHDGYGEVT